MFKHIDLKGLAKSPLFGYAAEQAFFKGKRKIEFKPGLNILFGPNSSGKSTILRMLGDTMMAIQGGVSTVTTSAVRDTVELLGRGLDKKSKASADKIGLAIEHDGQPVVYCDPRQAVGLMGGAFDDDFFTQGFQETMTAKKRSHGQQSITRADNALGLLLGKTPFPEKIDWRITKSSTNDVWGEALDVVKKRMTGTIPKGQPTILLDEPEVNCSIIWQARLWKLLSNEEVSKKFQIIVATHSPFALGIGHAHYIELETGFRQEAESMLRERFSKETA